MRDGLKRDVQSRELVTGMRVSAYTGRQRERHKRIGLGLSRNKGMLQL